jgi:L-iditol 2-dehydrogenase
MGNLCDNNLAIGYQFPGGFAQFCLLNTETVRFGPICSIPSRLSDTAAALAEPLACCINGMEVSHMKPGMNVLVIGAGPIGLLLCRTAAAFGAGVVALADRDSARVTKAKDLGFDSVFCTEKMSISEIINQFNFQRKYFDRIFIACPSPDAQEQAIEAIAKRGVINLFGGLPGNSRSINISSNILHYREAYLTGSHGSTPRQHSLAMSMIASGRIKTEGLVTHKYPLTKIEQAFNCVENRLGLKVAINPWEEGE